MNNVAELTSAIAEMKELDRRAGDGMDVRLLWSEADGTLRVVVEDWRAGESFEIEADPANALDVFNHPYAYRR
jgi:hypothetical protein